MPEHTILQRSVKLLEAYLFNKKSVSDDTANAFLCNVYLMVNYFP